MMFGMIGRMLDESTIASSGTSEEPVKLIHPTPDFQRKDLILESVPLIHQAARISPLCPSMAVGYFAFPDLSRRVEVPNDSSIMLNVESLFKVTGISVTFPV